MAGATTSLHIWAPSRPQRKTDPAEPREKVVKP